LTVDITKSYIIFTLMILLYMPIMCSSIATV